MNPADFISIQNAAEKHGVHRNTLNFYIKTGKIEAKRQGKSTKSPWLVFEPSLVAYLSKTRSKSRKSGPDLNEQQKPTPFGESSAEASDRDLSLRDSATAIFEKIEEASDAQKAPVSPSNKYTAHQKGGRRHPRRSRRHSTTNARHGTAWQGQQDYLIKVTGNHLKDAIRHMSLDEKVQLRDWITLHVTKVISR